ncbi:DNA-directed RNA polymerase subunit alpha [Candidatus Marinimicrobia bacterium]|nr:DNA-directed RNA polymerase subunit alpha [Candidatus Neomarinimicrobiota bacterium]
MSGTNFEEIKIKFIEDTDNHAKIVAGPFDRGYGVTVGNALRRGLMTSIPGSAIVSVKIEGVQHEFSNIEGVLEDVSDIILNLKELIFKNINDGPEEISLSLKGPMEFKGKHIEEKINDFTVLNPDHLIATLNAKSTLSLDIRIARGKGYSNSLKNKRSDDVIGTIPMDSIFNPITNVSWDVEPITSSTEDQESLTMSVSSNGATKPKDAMNYTANLLRQQIQHFMFDDSLKIKEVNDDEINEALQLKGILSKSIDEMELSVRSHNCLQAAGIYEISELVSKDEGEMLKYKNFGRKSLTELCEKLSDLGLRFGMDIKELMETE